MCSNLPELKTTFLPLTDLQKRAPFFASSDFLLVEVVLGSGRFPLINVSSSFLSSLCPFSILFYSHSSILFSPVISSSGSSPTSCSCLSLALMFPLVEFCQNVEDPTSNLSASEFEKCRTSAHLMVFVGFSMDISPFMDESDFFFCFFLLL